MTRAAAHAIDWHGNDWTPDSDEPAAHPNARFTTPPPSAPRSRRVGGPEGRADRRVPVRRAAARRSCRSCARRSTGSTRLHGRDDELGDDRGGRGAVGALRFDPFAMLPFCGYNMADYFAHWLKIGRRDGAELPKVFYVNWFRKDEDGKYLWPGFGENSRVLAYVFRRCDGDGETVETPIGLVPAPARSTRTASSSPTSRCGSC
jgi:phosphoenolpyruvate carboxykinase (GTP)